MISIEGALLLWEDPGIFNSWSQVSLQQTDKALAQHSTQASLIGIPSGRFLHLWQALRFELCALTFPVPLVQRLPADLSVMEASCQWETRTTLSTITECRQDAPHWTTWPAWLHIIKNKDSDFFFFFIKNLLRWCNYRLFFKNYLQLTGPEKRHFFFCFSFFLLHSFDSVPYKPHTS